VAPPNDASPKSGNLSIYVLPDTGNAEDLEKSFLTSLFRETPFQLPETRLTSDSSETRICADTRYQRLVQSKVRDNPRRLIEDLPLRSRFTRVHRSFAVATPQLSPVVNTSAGRVEGDAPHRLTAANSPRTRSPPSFDPEGGRLLKKSLRCLEQINARNILARCWTLSVDRRQHSDR